MFRKYFRILLLYSKDTEIIDQTVIHVFFNDLVSTHYRKDIYQNWLGVLGDLTKFLNIIDILLYLCFIFSLIWWPFGTFTGIQFRNRI